MARRRSRRRHRRNYILPRCLLIALFMSATVGFTSFTINSAPEAEETPSELSTTQQLYLDAVCLEPVSLDRLSTAIPSPKPECDPWTEEEVVVLAKMVYGEARGVPSKMEQAACVWCVLNRCDAYGEGIVEVTTEPYQFVGYDADNPVTDELYELCEDVLSRWYAEKNGNTNVGRVLPSDYLYFHGDGEHNYFRNAFQGGTVWDWSYPNPYET